MTKEEFRLTWNRIGKVSHSRLFAIRKGVEKRYKILANDSGVERVKLESRPVGKWKVHNEPA